MSTATMANTAQALMESMTPKFAVSYLRVSTRGQAERGGGHDEGFSIPAQREANKKKAASLGAIVGKEFVDRGASAKSADRPQLQAMLEYVKENAERVDYVIVHKVDRLARNRDDDSDIMRALRECGVQLVSASESIDETPAGMLLHGIMSSIAEFYSQNLATEVKKGMGEKIKCGGTVSRAPLGYINVRNIDEKGREERTVILDPERAPLVKMAFEYYASEQWTINGLADYLGTCGLTTRPTPRMPEKPIPFQTLQKMLTNPYYKGSVRYKGIEYAGSHEPIIDTETWDKVQLVLHSKVNGERNHKHPHFLKSTVYCAYCGERMIVSNEKKKNGDVYPYFVCAGRHSKRHPDCKTKYCFIPAIEKEIEKLYDKIQLPDEVRTEIETYMQSYIAKEKEKYDIEIEGLHGRKHELEHRRSKLMEAHYMDAIPLDFMKSEQQKITKELAEVEHEIKQHAVTFEEISKNLSCALEMLNNIGQTYRMASDKIKRLMNQALFEKIYITNNDDIPLEIQQEYRPPFDSILKTVQESHIAEGRTHDSGCGLAANNALEPSHSNFFKDKISSKTLLVALSGLSSNYSTFSKLCKTIKDLASSPDTSVKSQRNDKTHVNECGKTEVKKICQKQKSLSKKEIEEIKKLYMEGMTSGKLAKKYGCHRVTVCNMLKKAGITVNPSVEGRKFRTEDAIRLYQEERLTVREIAKKLGVCEGSIYKCLKRNNIDTKRTRWDYER